jgi:hypothetical protein
VVFCQTFSYVRNGPRPVLKASRLPIHFTSSTLKSFHLYFRRHSLISDPSRTTASANSQRNPNLVLAIYVAVKFRRLLDCLSYFTMNSFSLVQTAQMTFTSLRATIFIASRLSPLRLQASLKTCAKWPSEQ